MKNTTPGFRKERATSSFRSLRGSLISSRAPRPTPPAPSFVSPTPRPSSHSPLYERRICFIGAGTMGHALIQGLLAKGMPARQLYAADPSPQARRKISRLGLSVSDDNRECRQADVIVLAVKPQEMPSVLADLASNLHPPQWVISIAAGIPLSFLESRLPRLPIVRVMPNLPATVGQGFSALAMGCRVRLRHRRIAMEIFNAVGQVVRVAEPLLDAITAVSGSGPAYVFFLAQVWEEAALRLGLPRAVARRAVAQTLKGSVQLLEKNSLSPQEWIARVASKRGTTEAALRVLEQRRVRFAIVAALQAAAKRSRQLSRLSQ